MSQNDIHGAARVYAGSAVAVKRGPEPLSVASVSEYHQCPVQVPGLLRHLAERILKALAFHVTPELVRPTVISNGIHTGSGPSIVLSRLERNIAKGAGIEKRPSCMRIRPAH